MKQKRIMGMLLVFTLVLVSAFVLLLAACFFHNTEKVSAASKMKLNKTEISMTVGTRYFFKVKNLPRRAKIKWTSSNRDRMSVSKKGIVKAKKPGKVTIHTQIKCDRNAGKRKVNLFCRIKIEKAPKVPEGATPISIEAGNVILDGVLFDNPTAKKFAKMLSLTVELWHPANFARAFDLKKEIPDIEPHT